MRLGWRASKATELAVIRASAVREYANGRRRPLEEESWPRLRTPRAAHTRAGNVSDLDGYRSFSGERTRPRVYSPQPLDLGRGRGLTEAILCAFDTPGSRSK
jgi:hypothetical protein